MFEEDMQKLRKALEEAFLYAINTVGIENFKKCSMFLSNQKESRHGS